MMQRYIVILSASSLLSTSWNQMKFLHSWQKIHQSLWTGNFLILNAPPPDLHATTLEMLYSVEVQFLLRSIHNQWNTC
jgi:hypothetical protein